MKLTIASVVALAIMSSVALAPVSSFAASATTTTTTTTAKPAKTPGAADPKQFTTDTAATATCPKDVVVWVNLSSKIWHLKGTKTYGTTKHGTFMCETDATAEGFHAPKKPEKQA
jgi:hypothetical protein